MEIAREQTVIEMVERLHSQENLINVLRLKRFLNRGSTISVSGFFGDFDDEMNSTVKLYIYSKSPIRTTDGGHNKLGLVRLKEK